MLALSSAPSARALTIEDLLKEPKLTPQKFARYFADFDYEYREQIVEPDTFLASRIGDCDDYATLAFKVLVARGFRPHLVIVRMPGINHVVCYVEESKGYLDYNLRHFTRRIQSCKPKLRSIANEVADTFAANWTSVSEFSYADGIKFLVATATKANPNAPLRIVSTKPPPGQVADFQPLQAD